MPIIGTLDALAEFAGSDDLASKMFLILAATSMLAIIVGGLAAAIHVGIHLWSSRNEL